MCIQERLLKHNGDAIRRRHTVLIRSVSVLICAAVALCNGNRPIARAAAQLGGGTEVGVAISQGGSFSNEIWADLTINNVTSDRIFTGDFNYDRRSDVLVIDYHDSVADLWVGISDGHQFAFSRWATWQGSANSIKVVTGDFDGDSRTDVMKFDQSSNCTGSAWVGLSNGVNAFNPSQWASNLCTPADIRIFAGDFNNDHKTDVMKIDASDNGNGGLWVGISESNRFTFSRWATWYTPASIKLLIGDFNGDNRTDVMKFDQSDNCTGGLWVGLSNGANAFNTARWATWCTPSSIRVQAGDFNGDGKTDVMKMDVSAGSSGSMWVGISNSSNAFSTRRWGGSLASTTVFQAQVGYFDLDTDPLHPTTDLMRQYKLAPNSRNHDMYMFVETSNGTDFLESDLWGSWQSFGLGNSSSQLTGDFNGDGLTDVVTFYPLPGSRL